MATGLKHIMFIFPGQGSQYRGMGSDLSRDFAAAQRVYEQASSVLGYDISELSFNDPNAQLDLTRFTQPALLTHSIACLEVFKELTDGQIVATSAAGHSLGEYSALVSSDALSFENALRLVQKRGELMGTLGQGEMLAFPLDLDSVRPLAERHYCGIGGCNLPEQTVVGGLPADLDLVAQDVLELFPRKRVVRLKTEGAFHTYLMIAAAQEFRPSLEAAEIGSPNVRVLSNYSGDFHESDADIIRSRLFFQLFHPVRWIAGLRRAMQDGVDTFIEFGGGLGAAEGPDGKRPNLESIIKKATRLHEHEAAYYPAINSKTLRETAETLSNS